MSKEHNINEQLILKTKIELLTIRREKNLTQEHVYYETGIHIGRLENKHYIMNINITTLQTLCNIYKITLGDLFKRIGE
jgi:transcriptional regulator with XRE-family HTH domain